MDSITPMVQFLPNTDINYFKESKCYLDDNIVWCVYSIFEENSRPDIESARAQFGNDKTYIGLYHAPVLNAKTDIGYEIDHGAALEEFEGGDMIWLAGYGTMTQNIDGKNFKTISGTSYTLLPWDHNNLYTNAADVTVTIPTGLALPHSSVHTQMNTGVVIFTGTAAVNSKGGADRTSGQYSPAALYATATNTYILGGDITV
jgi:hypothetical protein